jgi:hypothetical protein
MNRCVPHRHTFQVNNKPQAPTRVVLEMAEFSAQASGHPNAQSGSRMGLAIGKAAPSAFADAAP